MPKATTQGQPFQVAVFHGCCDGDTCTASLAELPPIFGDHITVRLAGIDTPEMKGTGDEKKVLARQGQAMTLVQATKIDLLDPKQASNSQGQQYKERLSIFGNNRDHIYHRPNCPSY
ncbi:MAG: hypothetical protein H8K05_00045 [Nitrospira sp.]|nr:hypothetical protein [Nitrospira sp.]